MKVASIRITQPVFLQHLHLPEGTTVVGASVDPLTCDVVLTVSHDDLVEQVEGAMGVADPTLRREADGTVTFLEWGQ